MNSHAKSKPFRDPELEMRIDQGIAWVESHIDDIEDRVKNSGLPTVSKIMIAPAILFRRRIYGEFRDMLANTTLDELRNTLLDAARMERRLWEFIEIALDEPDWIHAIAHGPLAALGEGDHPHGATEASEPDPD